MRIGYKGALVSRLQRYPLNTIILPANFEFDDIFFYIVYQNYRILVERKGKWYLSQKALFNKNCYAYQLINFKILNLRSGLWMLKCDRKMFSPFLNTYFFNIVYNQPWLKSNLKYKFCRIFQIICQVLRNCTSFFWKSTFKILQGSERYLAPFYLTT